MIPASLPLSDHRENKTDAHFNVGKCGDHLPSSARSRHPRHLSYSQQALLTIAQLQADVKCFGFQKQVLLAMTYSSAPLPREYHRRWRV
jgi:hypothetical protein